MEYTVKLFILFSVLIFIIYCNWPVKENFNVFKKIGKDIKKTAHTVGKDIKNTTDTVGEDIKNTANTVGKGIEKTADNIGKEVIKDVDVLKRDTKKIGKFIVKEGKSLIKGVENFSDEVWKYSESYINTAINDIKTSAEIAWSLVPIGGVIDAIYQEITTGHIDWEADFDPCYIIAKDLQKVSTMIAPLINLVSSNLAKIIIKLTQIKTITIHELQPSLNACILSAFNIASGVGSSVTSTCKDSSDTSSIECSSNCEIQIPKLICDVLPRLTCGDLVISSSDLYKSNNPTTFNICKFGNTCKGSSDITTLLTWIQCLLAPEACAISKTLGAVCSITDSLLSGQSVKNSTQSGLDSVEGFKDTGKGAYYIKSFQGDVVFQCANKQDYNLSVNKVLQNDLYKNMNIIIAKYNENTKWEIIYNQDKTVYIKNTITNNYIGYGNLTLNYDQLYENMNKNVIHPMNGIYPQTNVTYTNSEKLLDNSNKWVLERQGSDSYIYAFPTLIASSYYIKNYSTNEYLSLENIQKINNSEETYTVVCSKTPYEWTLIPDKYYQPEKYVTQVL